MKTKGRVIMKILSIGNSFSQDAQRYLYGIAKHNGDDIKNINLYIGGCPLHTHFKNITNNASEYAFEYKGNIDTGIKVSILEALQSDMWDYITLQQASNRSFQIDSYTPYIERLAEYCRYHAPKAKILLHQTWGYETGSNIIAKFASSFDCYESMQTKICECYAEAAKLINADGIIPCGETMRRMLELGAEKIHRDGYHADYGFGRYAQALTWYGMLFGKDVANDTFSDFDVEVPENLAKIARQAASDVLKANKLI